MGESNPGTAEVLARRRRRVWLFSLAIVLPLAVFTTMLGVAPAALGWVPFGGHVSIALYAAVFLYAWPVALAVLYIVRADRDPSRRP